MNVRWTTPSKIDKLSLMKALSDQIRDAARRTGLTRYAISKETGISQPTLMRFMEGRVVTSETLDILAEYLGLRLEKPPQRSRKR